MRQRRPIKKKRPLFFYFLNCLSYFFSILFFITIVATVIANFYILKSTLWGSRAFASLFRFTGHLALLVGIGVLSVTTNNHRNQYAQRHNIRPYDSHNFFPSSPFTDAPGGYIFGTALSLSIFLFYFGAQLASS